MAYEAGGLKSARPRFSGSAAALSGLHVFQFLHSLLVWLSAKPCMIAIFMFCALPAGVAMLMITPLGQVPDEPAHMARAAGLLHGALICPRRDVVDSATGASDRQTGLMIDTGLMNAAFGQVTLIEGMPKVTQADYFAMRNLPSQHRREFISLANTCAYFPIAYAPAAAGLIVARVVNAAPFISMEMARLSMLLACLLLGSAAIWITAYGEAAIMAVLLTPMTLSLASSLNQDGMLISMACLCAACLTRDNASGKKFKVLALGLLVAIMSSKPPYIALFGLALLPFTAPGWWQRARDMLLASVPVFAWAGVIAACTFVPFSFPPYHPGAYYSGARNIILTHTDPSANLHILLAAPVLLITMPWQLLSSNAHLLAHEAVGILGWLALIFPDRYYTLWLLTICIAFAGPVFVRREIMVSRHEALLRALLVPGLLMAAWWSVALSLYLSWTLVGMPTINGMQGRYILLLLPFLILAVPYLPKFAVLPKILPALPVIMLGIYDLGYLPLKLTEFFYIH